MAVKSKKVKLAEAAAAAAALVVPEPETPRDNEITGLSENYLLKRLIEKLSYFDAQMILDAAMNASGVVRQGEACFKRKEAKMICLALIKRGGPAFAVGQVMYREFVG